MSLCEGVTFSGICREWRGKWSEDADKASLVAVNKLFNETPKISFVSCCYIL